MLLRCSSVEYLQEARARLSALPGNAMRSLGIHLEAAVASRTGRPIKVFRTLDEFEPPGGMVPYAAMSAQPLALELSVLNCHDGQRKLVLGVLEFLVAALKHLRCDASALAPPRRPHCPPT
jgi:hypothetical protein